MSLFENDEFRWRETYFVMMKASSRPAADSVQATLKKLNRRYELGTPRTNEIGLLGIDDAFFARRQCRYGYHLY